jgi:hypothetical protein
MNKLRDSLRYRVVGIRANASRDVRFENLSLETAEMVLDAMIISKFYRSIVVEDQKTGAVCRRYDEGTGKKSIPSE